MSADEAGDELEAVWAPEIIAGDPVGGLTQTQIDSILEGIQVMLDNKLRVKNMLALVKAIRDAGGGPIELTGPRNRRTREILRFIRSNWVEIRQLVARMDEGINQ